MIFLMHCISPSNSGTSCSRSAGSTMSVMREDRYDILDALYHPPVTVVPHVPGLLAVQCL